jgi:hypothetical protein
MPWTGNKYHSARYGVTFVTLPSANESATITKETLLISPAMEVHTPKMMRRSTRLRVEIPVSVTSLDRQRPFAERCVVLVASAQGCGFRSTRALQLETPVLIGDLPGGGSVTARVANCLPLGNDGFLIGAALYNHGNVWGIADAPEDWNIAAKNDPVAAQPQAASVPRSAVQKKSWPYNLFSEGAEVHPGRK